MRRSRLCSLEGAVVQAILPIWWSPRGLASASSYLIETFIFASVAVLLTIRTAEVVLDRVRGDDLQKSIQRILMMADEPPQSSGIAGKQLQKCFLNQIVDQGRRGSGPVAESLDYYAGDYRLRAADELGPEEFVGGREAEGEEVVERKVVNFIAAFSRSRAH